MENSKKTPAPLVDGYVQLLYQKAMGIWAEWMGRQSLRLGRRGLIAAFAAVTLAFGACCLLLIFSGGKIFYTIEPSQPDAVKTIRAPSAAIYTGTSPDTLTMMQVKAFRSYMDQLEASQKGRKTRDSILKARPGLIDSIRIVESMYNNKKDE